MPILSAVQASLAERWDTMDTMVCSIFSGAKSDVCASVDLLRVNLELGADICSFVAEIIPVSEAVVVLVVVVVVVGAVVGGWKVVAVLETGPAVVVVGPA